MSLARKIKRQQERKVKHANMKAFYDHADRVVDSWDAKEKARSEERTMASFSFILAMCVRVLVRDFGFAPLPKSGTARKNSRIVKFAMSVEEEVRAFDSVQVDAMKRYCDKVYEECGVKFGYE